MWNEGDLIVRRELLGYSPIGPPPSPGPWHGQVWLEVPVYVVEDSDECLATYIAPGAEFGFPAAPDGGWPYPGGIHPWQDRSGWAGEGMLMVQRPGEHHAVWHFWNPSDGDGGRALAFWYLNLQTAFRRTEQGYDTQDLEVDFVVPPQGPWTLKDYELLDERVALGHFWPELRAWIEAHTAELSERLDAGERWWDDRWSAWTPPPEWRRPDLATARSGRGL